jgi:hypothetical protein
VSLSYRPALVIPARMAQMAHRLIS